MAKAPARRASRSSKDLIRVISFNYKLKTVQILQSIRSSRNKVNPQFKKQSLKVKDRGITRNVTFASLR